MSGLKEELISRISAEPEKMISFRDYMDLCLYHPRDGYYMQERNKIGKQGDYYTSSSVHPVFAETLAHFVYKICQTWGTGISFCEMGAGTGLFAGQFLDALQDIDEEAYQSARYIIIEKSPYHQKEQLKHLTEHTAQVIWAEEPVGNAAGDNTGGKHKVENPLSSFAGILFSNELVDAFPVHMVEKKDGTLWEICVGYDEVHDRFVEHRRPVENELIVAYLEDQGFSLAEGWRMEIPLDALIWVEEVSDWFQEGLWLTFDYGLRRDQWEAPSYRQGTLRCFYRHQVDDNPYEHPGQKDITAHVHFEGLSQTAQRLGWKQVGLFPQVEFLLMAGILDRLEEHQETDPFHSKAKKNRAIRQLISPEGISGAFQVLTLAKSVPDKVLDLFQPFSFGLQMIKKGY
ncbi:SAM-dependent MidA family methyltransferase [Caldalkalibacillus uzonensis]|uniref:SAM-dependent MidA family methyltransferase n=1 Tax=Caldalkalibacillus uzonensis TaxID=353224 RepID=A0ABU0CSN8_9BACI|nr:SAM-dependent methyltransferase [Caldalkalibacillus uzonensis]MDQ0339147.1 SAM-dependent MidA family methyltransferase [Caldalkalibacillus uzonensis]